MEFEGGTKEVAVGGEDGVAEYVEGGDVAAGLDELGLAFGGSVGAMTLGCGPD